MTDLRYAWRQLTKSPGFAVVAILILAMGMGSSTVIFSAINTLFFQPLPLQEPERVVRVYSGFPDRGLDHAAMSWPRFQELSRQQTVFSDFGAAAFTALTLTGKGEPEQLNALRISGRWFPALGISPVLGRTFSIDEDRPGGAPVALISHRLWQRRFGADPKVLGQTLLLDNLPYTLVGILPPNATVPFPMPEVWIPHADQPEGLSAVLRDQGSGYLQLVARLLPGVSVAQADEALRTISRRYAATVPDRVDARADIRVVSLHDDLVGQQRGMFGVLFAAVLCVLLIGCANVVNLLLARFAARRREIAVRAALGATRDRLIAQFIWEGLVLSLAAGLVGIFISVWGVEVLRQWGSDFIPRSKEITLDWRVLLFSLGLAILTGVALGLVPGWQVTRHDISDLLKDASRSATGSWRQGRFRAALLIGEVGLSLVLLVGAGLLLLSFIKVLQVDPGIQPRGVAVVNLMLPPVRYPNLESQARVYEQIAEALRGLPGVTAVSATSSAPFSGNDSHSPVAAASQNPVELNDRPLVRRSSVLPGYFAALGIPLRRGRDFDARDRLDHPLVCIVSESFARKTFGDRDPIGQRLITGLQSIPREVVGVVADTRAANLTQAAAAEMYYPCTQLAEPGMSFVLRSSRPSLDLHQEVRKAVRTIDAGLPVPELQTLERLMADTYADRRLTLGLLAGFAGVALAMAVFGIYSVMAYNVSQRSSEIGIRLALGARPLDVQRLVVREGMTLAGAGLGLGVAVALSLTHVMAALLFGVGPRDPVAFICVSVLLAAVSFAACWWPARRAARVDPMIALRTN